MLGLSTNATLGAGRHMRPREPAAPPSCGIGSRRDCVHSSHSMRRRRIVLVVVLVVVALLAYFPLRATVFAPRFDVPSIAATPQYKDAALFDRAWSLPVAQTFERRVV